ncbi:MAG: M43 family zinc metalloprotease, partial [Bacteroidota bacterium]
SMSSRMACGRIRASNFEARANPVPGHVEQLRNENVLLTKQLIDDETELAVAHRPNHHELRVAARPLPELEEPREIADRERFAPQRDHLTSLNRTDLVRHVRDRLTHRRDGQRKRTSSYSDDECSNDRERDGQRHRDLGPRTPFALDRHHPAEPEDVGLHDVHPHAPSRHVGDFGPGAEPRQEHQVEHVLPRHLFPDGMADQTSFPPNMKKTITLMLLCFLAVGSVYAQQQRSCAAMDDLEHRKQQDPTLELRMQEIEEYTQKKISELGENRIINGDIITIPVVVHILYTNSTNNISDAQILSQIDVLNEDFRRLNSDADGTWAQAADTQIEFCMATIDPNGVATTGITRKSTTQNDWYASQNNMKKSAHGGIDPWNTSEYLNMWTVPKILRDDGATILGYAQFPGGSAATDGVVMGYNYFGNIEQVSAPFDLGRTTTHEVGHFLNLRHIWGDGGCGIDDFVADTPESDFQNFGCNPSHVSCGTVDMVQNYMDYSDDACMNLFTQGQTDRMRVTLLPGGVRAALGASDKCGPPPAPTCTDGVQNGDETGVDCGGSTCAPCPEPTCSDGIQNQGETGVDCGGPNCAPCQIACTSTETNFPYNEGFENTTGAWTQDAGDDFDWTVLSGSTGSSNTGPSSADEGSYYIYMESSTPNYSTKRAILNSPCFDLSGATAPSISFKYHMYGASNMGSLALEATTDGINWTSIWSAAGNQGNSWLSASVDLSAYNGTILQVRFNGVTGTTWQGDMAIDALNVITSVPAPTCSDGIQNGDETGVDCGGATCAPCSTGGSDILHEGYFESGWDNWQDGGSDVSRYSGSRSYEGSYSIRLRDNSGTSSAMTSETFDVSSYDEVEVSFHFYSYSMENNEDFWLRYYDGSAWITVETWARGTDFENNGFYSATVTVDAATYTMANNAQFRFQCDASGNGDHIYIDQVVITGINTGGGARVGRNEIEFISGLNTGDGLDTEVEFVLHPNPLKGSLLTVTIKGDLQPDYRVVNILGQTVTSGTLVNDTIDLGNLEAGVYFVELTDGDEKFVKRFIKE